MNSIPQLGYQAGRREIIERGRRMYYSMMFASIVYIGSNRKGLPTIMERFNGGGGGCLPVKGRMMIPMK